jgi:acyl-CoA thioesterase FadM
LSVHYVKPTPIGVELEVRGRVKEAGERKFVVEATLVANGVITARGEVVAVRIPTTMIR